MFPGFFGWRHAHGAPSGARCGSRFHGGCGPGGDVGGPFGHHPGDGGDGPFGGGGFGVRRPLRFLAWKLELEEKQVAELAAILDELKTERAQAAVDFRRTTSAFADLVTAGAFDAAKAEQIAKDRVRSAERREVAVSSALAKIHALLDEEQRKRLAYLLRTGVLSL